MPTARMSAKKSLTDISQADWQAAHLDAPVGANIAGDG